MQCADGKLDKKRGNHKETQETQKENKNYSPQEKQKKQKGKRQDMHSPIFAVLVFFAATLAFFVSFVFLCGNSGCRARGAWIC